MTWVVPVSVLIFVLAALVWPLVRLYTRTGTLGFVGHRGTELAHRLTGAAFVASVAGGAAYALGVAAFGADRMGSWPVPIAVFAGGVVLMAVGLGIIVAAQSQMGGSWRIGIDDRPTDLVEHGLYAWTRNPIYTGVLVWITGLLLAAPGIPLIVAAIVVTGVVSLQARLEEAHLLRLHGDRYRRYASRVGRFLPGIGRLGSGDGVSSAEG
jgi:protein-S-isoprenylcysteine O-methyltransferase Ste14